MARRIRTLFLFFLLTIACDVVAEGRHVVFVDAASQGGVGTYDRPFTTIRDALRHARAGTVVYVAEAASPYEESVTLRKGQMLIGSAYGLAALRAEMHADLDTPDVPAVAGPGPVIHGSIVLSGDNVVAGCSLVADRKSGPALVAASADGPLTLRDVRIRTSEEAAGFWSDNIGYPISWIGGAIDAARAGSGIQLTNVHADITFQRLPLSGDFATALRVHGASGAVISFGNKSPIRISSSTREAISIEDASTATVRFDSPLQIRSAGRAFVARGVGRLVISGGQSWIESASTAMEIHDAATDVILDHVSVSPANGASPGAGIVLDKVRNRFEILGDGENRGSGGMIRDARSYGIRITQSTGVHLRNVSVSGGGSVNSPEECPQDIPRNTNLGCRAGIFLRHVDQSEFVNLSVESVSGVGVNANNLGDVKFASLRVANSGTADTEPALLLDEVQGNVSFERCAISNGSGGAARIEQQFNRGGKVTFDRCEIDAAGVEKATALVRINSWNGSKVRVGFSASRIHDNAAGAIEATAGGRSTLILTLRDSYTANLGDAAVVAVANDQATAVLNASGNQFAPAVRRQAAGIDIRLHNAGVACVDAFANDIAASLAIAIGSDSAAAVTRLVGAASEDELSQRNGGAAVRIVGTTVVKSERCD